MAFMCLSPPYTPDDRLPAETYSMVIPRIRDEPADGYGNIVFSKAGVLAILEAALRQATACRDGGPPLPDYGR